MFVNQKVEIGFWVSDFALLPLSLRRVTRTRISNVFILCFIYLGRNRPSQTRFPGGLLPPSSHDVNSGPEGSKFVTKPPVFHRTRHSEAMGLRTPLQTEPPSLLADRPREPRRLRDAMIAATRPPMPVALDHDVVF